jgi:hypothetical protein
MDPAMERFFLQLRSDFSKRHPDLQVGDGKPSGNFLILTSPLGAKIIYKWSFSFGRFRAEIAINTGDRAKNKTIFDRLLGQRSFFERALDHDLTWYRGDNVDVCRIQSFYSEPASPDTSEPKPLLFWGTSEMKRLSDLFLPAIDPML